MLILFFFLVLQSSASQVNRLLQMHPDVIYVKSVRRIPASGISSRGLSDLGYEVKPRSLGYYFSHDGIVLLQEGPDGIHVAVHDPVPFSL